MPTVTLKLPARYATVRPASLLTGGVEVIIDHLTLSSLADAINAMEHNDTDPGERRMNADQCRDALLREVLHSWTPSELVEAKIPGVNEMHSEFQARGREIVELSKQVATVPVVLNPPKQDKDCGDCTRLVICNGELACLCGPTGKMFDRKPDAPQSDAVVVPKDLLERKADA